MGEGVSGMGEVDREKLASTNRSRQPPSSSSHTHAVPTSVPIEFT
jgi:hypothetical protein